MKSTCHGLKGKNMIDVFSPHNLLNFAIFVSPHDATSVHRSRAIYTFYKKVLLHLNVVQNYEDNGLSLF